MKIKIKRFDKSLPLPVYKTAGAVCVDLCCRTDISIEPQKIAYIPMNVAIEMPPGYWALQAPRSSTHKLGLMQVNSIGIVDSDYCGDNDEYLFPAFNFTNNKVNIEKGTRLSQLMILKFEPIEFEETDHLNNADRGGLGSTGVK